MHCLKILQAWFTVKETEKFQKVMDTFFDLVQRDSFKFYYCGSILSPDSKINEVMDVRSNNDKFTIHAFEVFSSATFILFHTFCKT